MTSSLCQWIFVERFGRFWSKWNPSMLVRLDTFKECLCIPCTLYSSPPPLYSYLTVKILDKHVYVWSNFERGSYTLHFSSLGQTLLFICYIHCLCFCLWGMKKDLNIFSLIIYIFYVILVEALFSQVRFSTQTASFWMSFKKLTFENEVVFSVVIAYYCAAVAFG